ncbi:MAG TPA: ABC transporter permease [Terracidiphilus sp.]|nr:ABC transporter permease [Terracidiphilus sp.]
MGELWRRIHYLFHRRQLDAELESDMEFHREMAARAGRNNFGNTLRMREQSREAWGWTWLDRLVQDFRFGTRILVRKPGFTFMIVLVLAIGIGVNIAAFSFFNMVALKPLPVRDPASLIRLERRSPHAYISEMAYPSFAFYRDHTHTLSAAIAVFGVPPMQINDDIKPTSTSFVTPNYFTELGTPALYGRLFTPALDGSSADAPAVILSYNLWEHRFSGDPSVIGQVIRINRKPATVVGVTPYTFASLGGQHPDIWMPIAQQPYFIDGSKALTDWTSSTVRMWGRLAPGITKAQAEQEMRTLTNDIRRIHPDAVWENEYLQISPGGHLQIMQPEMLRVAVMVGILTLLILAVACANVGGLLLARGISREHEIGIRVAIGASRIRIFRQLCTESFMLAALGSIAGIVLSYVVLRIALSSFEAPGWLSPIPDGRVLFFTGGIMMLAVLFFGFAPALQIARQRHRGTLVRQILLAAQVTASCVLLIVSGLLVRAAQHVLFNEPGFGYESTVSIDPQLGQHGYSDSSAKAYLDEMQQRLRELPGMHAVALVRLPPMGHIVSREDRELNGRKVAVYPNWVSPSYFDVMQTPILTGRVFTPGEKHVALVSKTYARLAWPNENPIGKTMPGDSKDVVIGVVGDAHVNALNNDDALESYYSAQSDNMPGMTIIARAQGQPDAVLTAARTISENLDPKLFPEMNRLKQLYRKITTQIELIAGIVSLIGFVAVLLAGVGILGIVSFNISQRTKEIAIRLALGSPKSNLCASLLRQFIWPIAAGLALGTGLALFASQFLRMVLFGVSNLDPAGYAAGVAVLLAVVALSGIWPARKAMKLNVARALHYE